MLVSNQSNTTAILQPLSRSTCISRHLQSRTRGFLGAKFYCPHALADGNEHIQIRKKTLAFSSTVLSTLFLYLVNQSKNSLNTPVPKNAKLYTGNKILLEKVAKLCYMAIYE